MTDELPDDSIGINKFVLRQTPESRFSHYEGTWQELANLTSEGFSLGNFDPGDRYGVLKITVPPEGFFSSLVEVDKNTKLKVTYEARREGEIPTKRIVATEGKKLPAKHVEIIIYAYDVLRVDNEQSTDATWEIISINASPYEGGDPITPGALMRNFFNEPGGTPGDMTALEFVEQLRKSRAFWHNKVMYDPSAGEDA